MRVEELAPVGISHIPDMGPTQVERMSAFVQRVTYGDISEDARQALKVRVLDSVACAMGALDGPPIRMLRAYLEELGGNPLATLIGLGGAKTSPDRAALYNSALVRYLDYNDSFLSKGETCHPSDNVGAVLAASEYVGASGQEFLTALAVAYQVQCRLSEEAPVRAKGFDHTTQGAYAVAAGVSKALRLDAARTANAIAISGTAYNALRVTRTGRLSNWKGLAYPNTAYDATHAAFLAKHGITGPMEVFEGNKGFMESVAGCFELDWSKEDLEAVRRTILKKYNAEIHSQSVLEGVLDLRTGHRFNPHEIECVKVDVFDVAYNIIGGGEEGDKRLVHTKEEADHSLPYMVAVALLDGEVTPAQYRPERILQEDVQTLLRQVIVRPDAGYSKRFPGEMCCRIRIQLVDGRVFTVEKSDYEGFLTRPMSWEQLAIKLDKLASPYTDAAMRREIVQMVSELDTIQVSDLMRLLARIGAGAAE
ncbi:MAG: MmgE/PrpD family protein [Chloroflexota bacterium]